MRRSAAVVRSALSPNAGKEALDTARGTAVCGWATDMLAASTNEIAARVNAEGRPGVFDITALEVTAKMDENVDETEWWITIGMVL